MNQWSLRIACGTLLLLCCTSCSKDGRKPVYPVEGRVTYQGKPTPNAMIVLHPVNGSEAEAERPLAYADDEGRFSLTTYDAGDGAPAGDYHVTVIWIKQVAERVVEDQPNLLPVKYADPHTSGLRVRIQEAANVLEPFELAR